MSTSKQMLNGELTSMCQMVLQNISNPSIRQKHWQHCHTARSSSPTIDHWLQDYRAAILAHAPEKEMLQTKILQFPAIQYKKNI